MDKKKHQMSRHIARFYAVDLDRTLLDTERLYVAFLESVKDQALKKRLVDCQQEVESTGGSFDVGSVLQRTMGISGADNIIKAFISSVMPQSGVFILPGAMDLLHFFDAAQLPYGIITTGGGLWQKAKLRAAGLDVIPHKVVTKVEKGEIIAEWLQINTLPSGFGGGHIEEVILIDDKKKAFEGLPSRAATGYWYTQAVPHDNVRLQKNVNVASTHKEIIAAETVRLAAVESGAIKRPEGR